MSLYKKCCFFVKLDVGCLLIGILTLMIAVGISIASIVLLSAEQNENFRYMHDAADHLLAVVHLDVNQKSKNLILSIILFVAVLSTISSISLLVGVRKRVAGLVLVYFAFGIFLTFFTGLSSLLLILKASWAIALSLITASLINIHFLVVVHTFYELQLSGVVLGQMLQASDFDDTVCLVETQTST